MLKKFKKLNPLIHNNLNLGIMSFLVVYERTNFSTLLKVLDANPGNLSRKLEQLSQVGYIKIRRDFINNKRMMIVEITQKGLQAYVEYMEDFQQYQKAYQKIKTLQS